MQYWCQTTQRFLADQRSGFACWCAGLIDAPDTSGLAICASTVLEYVKGKCFFSKWVAKNVTGRCFPHASTFICVHNEKEKWVGRGTGVPRKRAAMFVHISVVFSSGVIAALHWCSSQQQISYLGCFQHVCFSQLVLLRGLSCISSK